MRIRTADERFDLFDPGHKLGEGENDKLSMRLMQDLPLVWELLWRICEPQATAKGIDAAQFGEAMAAECLVAGQLAFFAEWQDFFHRLQRPEAAMALEKMTSYQAKMIQLMRAKLADPRMAEMDQKVGSVMESRLNNSYGSLLESLDAILARSPGVNSTG